MKKINRIIRKETFVKKIESKHHVTMFEVEEILHMAKGKFGFTSWQRSRQKRNIVQWGK